MTGGKLRTSIFISLILLLGIVLAALLYFYQVFYKSPYFMPGVKIASASVAGYTNQEATSRLKQDIEEHQEAPIVFYYQEHCFESKLGELSYPVNYTEAVENVWRLEQGRDWYSKLRNLDGSSEVTYPLKMEYKPEIKAKMVEKWNKVLGAAAEDARLEMDKQKGLIIIPARRGLRVDAEQTFAKLPREWGGMAEIRIPITMQEELPRVKDEDLSNMGELASFSTWFNAGEINRSHNLYLATAAINAFMLSPGEVFSFNRQVGERVTEAGYRDALVIVNGKFEPGLGGGVCQVSSTLYNAVLLAGLEIVERYNHALAVAYVPVGRDATVAYGLQDLRFRNDSPYPIYIKAWAQGGKLTMIIYGNLTQKGNIQISTIVDQTTPFQEIRENDPSLSPGQEKIDHAGIQGYTVRSFRNYLDEEGRLLKSEQLARDYYRPLDKLIYVGPDVEVDSPAEEKEETEDLPDEPSENDLQQPSNNFGETLPPAEPEALEAPDLSTENADGDMSSITL